MSHIEKSSENPEHFKGEMEEHIQRHFLEEDFCKAWDARVAKLFLRTSVIQNAVLNDKFWESLEVPNKIIDSYFFSSDNNTTLCVRYGTKGDNHYGWDLPQAYILVTKKHEDSADVEIRRVVKNSPDNGEVFMSKPVVVNLYKETCIEVANIVRELLGREHYLEEDRVFEFKP